MSDIEVTVQDDSTATHMLEQLQERTSLNSLRNFLASVAWPFERARITKRFADEGDETVGPWAQLRLSTMRIREVQGFPFDHPINVRTGAMERHLTNSFVLDDMGFGVRLKIPGSPGSSEMQSKLRVAQRGGGGGTSGGGKSGPNRPAPPRPVLALDEIDARFMQDSLFNWVMGNGSP